jgi:hypothetical protein
VCRESVLAQLDDPKGKQRIDSPVDPISWGKGNPLMNRFKVVSLAPNRPKTSLPDGIPENVRTPLLEGELSYQDGRYSAAGSCYRKAMERAIKHLDSSIDGMLNRRIRELEKSQLFPKSMIELVDHVRLFGNESMHEDDFDPKKEDCAAAREFSMLFLTYAFSLPQKIEAARNKTIMPE